MSVFVSALFCNPEIMQNSYWLDGGLINRQEARSTWKVYVFVATNPITSVNYFECLQITGTKSTNYGIYATWKKMFENLKHNL